MFLDGLRPFCSHWSQPLMHAHLHQLSAFALIQLQRSRRTLGFWVRPAQCARTDATTSCIRSRYIIPQLATCTHEMTPLNAWQLPSSTFLSGLRILRSLSLAESFLLISSMFPVSEMNSEPARLSVLTLSRTKLRFADSLLARQGINLTGQVAFPLHSRIYL